MRFRTTTTTSTTISTTTSSTTTTTILECSNGGTLAACSDLVALLVGEPDQDLEGNEDICGSPDLGMGCASLAAASDLYAVRTLSPVITCAADGQGGICICGLAVLAAGCATVPARTAGTSPPFAEVRRVLSRQIRRHYAICRLTTIATRC